MPIITMQRRLRELGRIRSGKKMKSSGGKTYPGKLETWRLTSTQRALLDEAAGLWGGTVATWDDAPGGDQWELVTETDTLPIVIPGETSVTQWMELWSGGGCQRRCDGEREILSDQPCLCGDEPECKPHTRLNVMLPDLSDLGQWRVESSGFYAATELAGVADLLAMAKASFVPARLRLEHRTIKRPDEPAKNFVVPVIELNVQLGRVLESMGVAGTLDAPATAPSLPAPAAPKSQPVVEVEPSGALAEVLAHIETGAVTKSSVLAIARRVADEFGESKPTSFDRVSTLSAGALARIAEEVAVKVGESMEVG